MSLTERVSDLTIPLGDSLHLGEVVRPKLDHSKEQTSLLLVSFTVIDKPEYTFLDPKS